MSAVEIARSRLTGPESFRVNMGYASKKSKKPCKTHSELLHFPARNKNSPSSVNIH
jgi:hypothetical protein